MTEWAHLLVILASQFNLPGTSSISTPLPPANTCQGCHGITHEDMAYEGWSGSVMGHAARDPLFLAALTEAEKDLPGAGGFCLRCHAPEAWVSGRSTPTDGSGLQEDDSGVTCSFCHRMDPSPWKRNGQYLVSDDGVMRGPYSDAFAPHRFKQASFQSTSELCASCHDLYNPLVPRVTPDGQPMNMPFPEQTTYTEWLLSDFAKEDVSCQNCHMPESMGTVGNGGPVRPDRSSHLISGGNAFLPGAIAFLFPSLGLSDALDRGILAAKKSLQEAAELSFVDSPAEVSRGEILSLKLRVTNLTGHKLPTGYPEGRRVWLALKSDELGIERGGYDASKGEPEDPAAIYHTIHGQQGQGPGHRLILNNTIYYDSRIPARGVTSNSTIAPVGKVFEEVSPGVLAHWDQITITATVPCDRMLQQVKLEAELWYQGVTKKYVESLVQENGANPHGQRLKSAFEAADPGPLSMERISLELPIKPSSRCGPPDAGIHPDAATMTDLGSAMNSDAGISADVGLTDAGEKGPSEGCRCLEKPQPSGFSILFLIGLFGCIVGRRRNYCR